MAEVYCDDSECIYNCEGECQKISVVVHFKNETFCASKEK